MTLTDKDGAIAVATVPAGIEVEVLAWQPFGAGGTRYRVLSGSGGVEGWLPAASLEPRPQPAPSKVARLGVARPVAATRGSVPRPRRSPATTGGVR